MHCVVASPRLSHSHFSQHDNRGVVSMANRGPGTNGSQFFITYGQHNHLDNVNTVFGKVIHGTETIDAMERVPVDAKYKPAQPIRVKSVTVHANPLADAE